VFPARSGGGPSGALSAGTFLPPRYGRRSRFAGAMAKGPIYRAEEALQPTAVFAEIRTFRRSRLGNIIFRPALREFEILISQAFPRLPVNGGFRSLIA